MPFRMRSSSAAKLSAWTMWLMNTQLPDGSASTSVAISAAGFSSSARKCRMPHSTRPIGWFQSSSSRAELRMASGSRKSPRTANVFFSSASRAVAWEITTGSLSR
jgi:hypothetical protein